MPIDYAHSGFWSTCRACYTVRMSGLLGGNSTLLFNLLDPGAFLFGLILMLFSAAIPLLFLLEREPRATRALLILLALAEAALIASVALDFAILPSTSSVEGARDLSILFANHRWLLFQAPL